jgi:transcriptional antiterminator NusG
MNGETFNWYALYVKSRHEFFIYSELVKKGMDVFLPSIKKLRQWQDRKKLVEFPIFPGYLFVKLQPISGEFLKVLKTKGVVTIVSSNPGNPSPISTQEIHSLRLLIENGKDIDIYPQLKEGERVRIKRGLLRGAEGILVEKAEQYIFVVNIKLLGKSVGVKVYADDLDAA